MQPPFDQIRENTSFCALFAQQPLRKGRSGVDPRFREEITRVSGLCKVPNEVLDACLLLTFGLPLVCSLWEGLGWRKLAWNYFATPFFDSFFLDEERASSCWLIDWLINWLEFFDMWSLSTSIKLYSPVKQVHYSVCFIYFLQLSSPNLQREIEPNKVSRQNDPIDLFLFLIGK